MHKIMNVLAAGVTALLSFHALAPSTVTAEQPAESVSYTVHDVRNLQDFLIAKPTE